MAAIQACRTEALGGHVERCEDCGALRYHYHSCRNRHCPKCQTLAKERWLAARRAELLPVGYFQQLLSAGTLKLAASTAPLADAAAQRHFFTTLYDKSWVVYAKRPFAGPQQVLNYLGRYTHRVAISNNRLLSCTDTAVRFRYHDYAHGNRRKVLELEPAEFIRRFLLHVLPSGFMRIRHYGILANRAKCHKLALARKALNHQSAPTPSEPESVEAFWLRVANFDVHQCPHCKAGRMRVVGPIQLPRARAPP